MKRLTCRRYHEMSIGADANYVWLLLGGCGALTLFALALTFHMHRCVHDMKIGFAEVKTQLERYSSDLESEKRTRRDANHELVKELREARQDMQTLRNLVQYIGDRK